MPLILRMTTVSQRMKMKFLWYRKKSATTVSVSLSYSNVSRKENLSFCLLTQRLLYRVKMVEKSFSQIYTKIASHFVSLTKLTHC